jgi:two-component system, LuxR family, response regulator FixJ
MNLEPAVFVVDDDPAVRHSLTALLRVAFPHVEAFASAAEFLAAYQPEQPGCLLLDVAMPDMNGLELQRRLREERIDLPIVFITGHGSVQMAVGALQAGAVDFIEKPFHDQQLWDGVRKALDMDAQHRRRKGRRASVEERIAMLTAGEREVFELVLEGRSNKDIAARLILSVRTIEDRRARVMRKMHVRSVAELVQVAMTR